MTVKVGTVSRGDGDGSVMPQQSPDYGEGVGARTSAKCQCKALKTQGASKLPRGLC